MRIHNFQWDDKNTDHIVRHNVDPEEAEEACYNHPLVLRGRQERYLVYGRTDNGRYLLVVGVYLGQGTMRVITARDMANSEKRLYKRKE